MRILLLLLVFGVGPVFGQTPQVPSRMDFGDISLRIREDARKEIQENVDALTKNPKYFNVHVQRARTYFPIIEKILREERVPEDIKYLVIQESALIADAVSSSDAVGFWQFKDFTAREMGLRVDRDIDERMNIVSATRAAARYIKKNNERYFDNWLMSVQAYQMGPGGAIKAGAEQYKGHKSMTIDRRTYWYVKKFLAHKVAFESAINGPAVVRVAEYWKGGNKSFNDIAKETGISTDQLEEYNKWLRRGKIPADRSYAVMLPVASAERLPIDLGEPGVASRSISAAKKPYAVDYKFAPASEYPDFSDEREARTGRVTKVNGRKAILAGRGDRAVTLASKGDISLIKFFRYNDMEENDQVVEGNVYYLQKKRSSQPVYHHVVEEGETFWSISQKYGIKKSKLLTRNRMKKEIRLQPGRILWLRHIRPANVPVEFVRPEPEKIPVVVKKDANRAKPTGETQVFADDDTDAVEILTRESEAEEVPEWPASERIIPDERKDAPEKEEVKTPGTMVSKKETIHVVRPGDTFYSISRKYSVKIDDILEWNSLKINDPLSIDQKLKLYSETSSEPEKKAENEEIYYTVQQGDTFYGISRKFKVSVDELKKLNGKTDDVLKPGERLRVR